MRATLRAALVIARRDYVATVWSRAFILFLIGPLFPIIFGILFASIGTKMQTQPPPPVIAVITDGQSGEALFEARSRLTGGLGPLVLPQLRIENPAKDPVKQSHDLLNDKGVMVVLSGYPENPVLVGSPGALDGYEKPVRLLIEESEQPQAKAATLQRHPIIQPVSHEQPDRSAVARGGQLLLLILTMILAGMLLSNLIEEKSSKVIEILAAAVPVDAIFLGKLIAMLGMSLTGIGVWSALAVSGVALLSPGTLTGLAVPAIGWPAFVVLGVVYFIASYLLLGALFLGIGSQAATVREVQTLSMPITMAQLIVFALASTAVQDPGGTLARIAAIFPWSSPFTMIANAAQQGGLSIHLLAIGWQMLWVAIIIRIAAGMFRRNVLKSGGGFSLKRKPRG